MRRFISLRSEHSLQEVELELPSDRPVSVLMPDILKALGWPDSAGDQLLSYELRTEAGEPLDPASTLDHVGIENSDVLWIRLAEPGKEQNRFAGQEIPASISPTGASAARSDSPAPPIEQSIEVARPSLVSTEGVIFELSNAPLIIGRASRTSTPEVDLTDLDPEFASSRQHAKILQDKDVIFLEPLPTTNGTFINGTELAAGERHALKSGDEILFGYEGVRLTFFEAGESLPSSMFG